MWNFCLSVRQCQYEPQLWTPRRFLLQLTYNGKEQIGPRINIKSYAESQWEKKYPLYQIRIGGNNLISALVARTGLFRVKQHRTYHDCWQHSDLKCDSCCVSLSSVRPCQTPFAHSRGIFFMYFGCLSYEILETCERVES